MNYTLHQLKIYLEVVKHKNITKAAEEMHMSQPALSMQLKNFQMQFEYPLIEIIGKKLYVTEFGLSIAETAENVIREAEELKYKTKSFEGLLTGKLTISSASTGKYVIPYFLSDFLKQNPGIDLKLDVSNKSKVIENLKENNTDFALVSVLPEELQLNEEILMENKLFMVNRQPKIRDKETRSQIFREKGSATRAAMDHYFKKPKQHKSLELTSNEAVKQAVIADLGFSIIPLIGIKNELLSNQMYIIPAKGLPIVTYWRLVWLKKKKLSAAAKAYLDFVKANKQEIINTHFQWYKSFKVRK